MLEHDHSKAAITLRLSQRPKPSYLRDWVYGGIDGTITTFAIVSGVVGANLGTGVILILGLANLLADGFSMAAGNYTGTKAEIDEYLRLREIEERHIDLEPEGEREEVRQILAAQGLCGASLEEGVDAVTSDKERWIDVMMQGEYGLTSVTRSPMQAALSTFAAFIICGAVPLLPFALRLPHAFLISIVATGLVFLAIGALKSQWSLTPAWRSGLETLAIGAAAATVAYVVGDLLKSLA